MSKDLPESGKQLHFVRLASARAAEAMQVGR